MASRRLAIAMLDVALLLLLLLSCAAAAVAPANGASSDAAALLAFKSAADPGNRLAFSPPPSSNDSGGHCRWPGVSCSSSGRVVRVILVNSGITGFFNSGTLGRLDQLRILNLQENSLAGRIPDLSPLLNLRALFLGHNRFGGSFPPSIVSLRRLRVLDLSQNHLAGPVPPALASLERLVAIRLDLNRFNGSLPAFNRSSLKSLNVSFNNFSGAIPTTAVLSSFVASSFAGNPGLCGEIIKRVCGDGAHILFFHGGNDSHSAPSPTNPSFGQNNEINLPGAAASSPSQKMHKRAIVAIALLAVSMLAIGILGVLLVTQRRRKRMKRKEILSPVKRNIYGVAAAAEPAAAAMESYTKEMESKNHELIAAAAMAVSEEKVKKLAKSGCLVFCAGEAPVYTLEQLMKSSAEMLGRGSLGTTYKAVLENRLTVTVKRLDATKLAATGKEAFERHMQVVGRLRHPNLVPLRAYFHAKEERLLVYDYRPNGSLHSLIHGSRSTSPKPLHWTSCLKIAEDVAQGLAYIHQASRLVHGNIKASNILLGNDFEACLTDNCLSFLVEPSSDRDDISGYRVPETQKSNDPFTPKSDIYCFGVLLLELLTGKSPLQHPILGATDVPAWVRSTREDGGDDEHLTMITNIANVAAACVQPSPDSRPTTWQLLKMIQELKEADTGGDDDNDSASIS